MAGTGGLASAYWATAGTTDTATQFKWLEAGIAAVIVAAAGYGAWLLTGHRSIQQRKRVLTRVLVTSLDTMDQRVPDTAVDIRERVFVAPRMQMYHRSGCLLLAGKELVETTASDQQRAGRRACGMCRP